MSEELREPVGAMPTSIQMRRGSETARLLEGDYEEPPLFEQSASESAEAPQGGTSSAFSSVLNVCNTVLGSGVLGMATAINRAGLGMVLMLLPAFALVAVYSLQLVATCMDLSGAQSYSEVGEKAFGKKGRLLVIVVVIVQQLGASIAYLVILADIIQPFMALWMPAGVLQERFIWQIIMAALLFPICMLKSINSLKFASGFSLLFLLSFVVLVVVEAIVWWGEPLSLNVGAGDITWFVNDRSVLGAVPILAFAFVCQQNVPPVYAELKDRSTKKWLRINLASVSICAIVYFVAGIVGYLRWDAFPSCFLPQNLLTNYFCVDIVPYDIILVAVGLSFALSWPLMLFELRHSLDILIFNHREHTYLRSFLLNLCIIVPVVAIAIEVPGIVSVFDVVGSTSAVMLVFITPSMFFLKLRAEPFRSRSSVLPVLIIGLGICLGVAAFTEALIHLIENASTLNNVAGIGAGGVCRTLMSPNLTECFCNSSGVGCNVSNATFFSGFDFLDL